MTKNDKRLRDKLILMQIRQIAIGELRPYKNNPRKNEQAVDKVLASIKEFGFKVPVIIDKDNVIVTGHTRYKAALQLGLTEVPCIIADDLTPKQIRQYRLADNRTAEFSKWDNDLLNFELSEIDLDMTQFGFEAPEEEVKEDEFIVNLDRTPVTKHGDIYQLDEHRVMCGDSLNEGNINALMNGHTGKCLFTSPPYNMAAGMYENYKDNLESQKFIKFNLDAVGQWANHLKGFLFWNLSYNKNSRWEFIEIIHRIIKESGMEFLELIVWDKGHGIPITSKRMLTRQYEVLPMLATEDELSRDMELYYGGILHGRATLEGCA